MNWTLLLVPLMAAFIGWLINRLSIKMLFRILHRRQPELAVNLGRYVSKEFISFDQVEQKITHPDNIRKILPHVEQHIDEFLRQRLKEVFPMISMFIGDKTINQLKSVFMQELERLFPILMKNYMNNLKQDLDLEKMVTDRLLAISPGQLQVMIYQNMSKEFRLVEIMGAVSGLLIGLLTLLLTIVLAN